MVKYPTNNNFFKKLKKLSVIHFCTICIFTISMYYDNRKKDRKESYQKYKEICKLILKNVDFKKIRGRWNADLKNKDRISQSQLLFPRGHVTDLGTHPISTILEEEHPMCWDPALQLWCLPHTEPANVRYWEGKSQACLRRGKVWILWKVKLHGDFPHRYQPG